jgi:hypothetical protein
MKRSDRRLAHRFSVALPLTIREWRSTAPGWSGSSVNLSACGVFLETDSAPGVGTVLRLRIPMPVEITGSSAAEWLFLGKVVRVESIRAGQAAQGVAVRFDYYEVSQPTAAQPPLDNQWGAW